ncbi:four and a half LIM domains protein 2-like isoform X2 [Lethenteron reissneri]|uniref:four and a half LIM domains protein 2-like isoform X2 n=1 Tax=Lethenteron reissneri TaxID=7753 RepID=UPI002AB68664|nr:four and a half LIM domains protein 2-like isoform X2 [Lethenteron reissneri]
MSEARVSEMSEALDCGRCGRSLLGGRYALGPQGAPHCLPCYDSHLASSCERCSKPIGCGSKELSYQERHWHEECFRCARCSASLCAQPFLCQGEQLLCGDCYCSEVAERCSGCSKPIAPGSRRMEYNDASWHEGCFVCSRCDKPIGSGSFVPREDGNFCTACYESHVALRCTHCNEVMKEGGVRYEGRPWHRECFVCGACGAQLAGQRFTSRGDGDGAEPLCLDCHAGLYAHKRRGSQVHLVRGAALAPRVLRLQGLQCFPRRQGLHRPGRRHRVCRLCPRQLEQCSRTHG